VDRVDGLPAGHFPFLGDREARRTGLEGGPAGVMLVEGPGSGLGLLRSERPESVSFSELSPAVRQKALEPRLLIVTKANRLHIRWPHTGQHSDADK